MATRPIASMGDALLRSINAAKAALEALVRLIADTGDQPDEDTMEIVDMARADQQAAMAWLEANAPRCPGCQQAFAFQRQPRKPNHCSWCGYDHDTGEQPGLVPA